MAHFAKLDENNVVINVLVVNNNAIDPNNEEESGIAFLTELTGYSNWKQTSYNNNIRKHYAATGYSYNEELDAFIPPKPFNSWIFNEETCDWDPPFPHPILNNENSGTYIFYTWNEEILNWEEIQLSE